MPQDMPSYEEPIDEPYPCATCDGAGWLRDPRCYCTPLSSENYSQCPHDPIPCPGCKAEYAVVIPEPPKVWATRNGADGWRAGYLAAVIARSTGTEQLTAHPAAPGYNLANYDPARFVHIYCNDGNEIHPGTSGQFVVSPVPATPDDAWDGVEWPGWAKREWRP